VLDRFKEEVEQAISFLRAIQRLIVAFAIEEDRYDAVEENLQFWKEAGYEPPGLFGQALVGILVEVGHKCLSLAGVTPLPAQDRFARREGN
jgi:hypothetical protein